MSLYPIIRRKRRPLVDIISSPVTGVAKRSDEPETIKANEVLIAPAAQVSSEPPVAKVGRTRLPRENKATSVN